MVTDVTAQAVVQWVDAVRQCGTEMTLLLARLKANRPDERDLEAITAAIRRWDELAYETSAASRRKGAGGD